MQIYRYSGAEDFLGGLISYDIDNLPPEEDLTPEQIRAIREKINYANYIPVEKHAEFFKRYPKYVHYSVYNFASWCEVKSRYNTYSFETEEAVELWNWTLQYGFGDIPIIEKLPRFALFDAIYNRTQNLEVSSVGSVFIGSVKFPEEIINALREKFPEIYNDIHNNTQDNEYKIIQQYMECPLEKNYTVIDSILTREHMEGRDPTFSKKLIQSSFYFEPANEKVNKRAAQFDTWGTNRMDGFEWLTELEKLMEAIENNQNVYDSDEIYTPFRYVYTSFPEKAPVHGFGRLYFENEIIPINTVRDIYDWIANGNVNERIYILSGNEDHIRDEISYIQNKDDDDEEFTNTNFISGIYLVRESGEYINILSQNDFISINEFTGSIRNSTFVSYGNVTQKYKFDLFREWFFNTVRDLERNDPSQLEYFYVDLFENPVFRHVIEKAGGDLFSVNVQNLSFHRNTPYDPKIESFDNIFPYKIEIAREIFNKIPQHIVNSMYDKIPTWFFYMGGIVPCSVLLERARNNFGDVKKIVSNIRCQGDSESVISILQAEIGKQASQAKETIKNGMKDFLNRETVSQYHLDDFDELFQQVRSFIDRNIGKDSLMYTISGKESARKVVLDELSKIVVYLIDPQEYTRTFDEQTLDTLGISPKQAAGIYIRPFAFGNEDPMIFIFKQSREEVSNILEGLLGVSSSGDKLDLSTEATLWHEFAHALTDQVVQTRAVNYQDEWLADPEELLAINYGQLEYIKKRLYQFFSNAIPLNDRITQGLIAQMKSDMIATFALEFHGMTKEAAMQELDEMLRYFDEDVIDTVNNLSREETVKALTTLFTEFFMRKFMGSKVGNLINEFLNSIKEKEIKVSNPPVVPERYEFHDKGGKDKIIEKLEKRPDYQEFFSEVKEKIESEFNYDPKRAQQKYRSYIHRYPKATLKKPEVITDLLKFLFEGPWTISDVNLNIENHVFRSMIPQSLLQDVKEIVQKERALRQRPSGDHKSIPTFDEAEEAGQFMAEMNENYGPDWMWVANSKIKMKKYALHEFKKEDMTPLKLSVYVESLKTYLLQEKEKLSPAVINIIQNLPSPNKIKKEFTYSETQILFESVNYAWKEITGKLLTETLSHASYSHELHGYYWMLTGGLTLKGVNYTTIIKNNINIFSTVLNIDPLVLFTEMSRGDSALFACIIRNGGMRVYVDSEGVGRFQVSDQAYSKWAMKTIMKLSLKEKHVKIIDPKQVYTGWDDGVLIYL